MYAQKSKVSSIQLLWTESLVFIHGSDIAISGRGVSFQTLNRVIALLICCTCAACEAGSENIIFFELHVRIYCANEGKKKLIGTLVL